jgi:hypothetical protein
MGERAGLEMIELRVFSTPFTAGWLGTERLVPWLPEGKRLIRQLPAAWRARIAIHLGCVFRKPASTAQAR